MASIDLDRIDRKIISELQLDGRSTNVELASRVHLSPSQCLRRTRRLEETGIIRGYTAVIDHRKMAGIEPVTEFFLKRFDNAHGFSLVPIRLKEY